MSPLRFCREKTPDICCSFLLMGLLPVLQNLLCVSSQQGFSWQLRSFDKRETYSNSIIFLLSLLRRSSKGKTSSSLLFLTGSGPFSNMCFSPSPGGGYKGMRNGLSPS